MIDNGQAGKANLRSRISAINLQHLRYAVAAADHGSFRQAAENLHLQQSTLSRCVRQLEDSVGVTIFKRSSGGVRATEAGRNVLRLARSILEQLDSLVITAHCACRGGAGRVVIGFYTSLSAGNLRATLQDYAQRFPLIEIALIESSRGRLVTSLRNGAIDVAIFTGEAPLPDSNSISLWSERIFVVLSKDHRLASKEAIYWMDLKGETLLLSPRDFGPEIHELFVARLTSPDDWPKIVHHDVSRESIKSLVGAARGITLTLEASLGANYTGVVHREVRDGIVAARVGHSASWREDNENPALRRFLQLLIERYPSPSA